MFFERYLISGSSLRHKFNEISVQTRAGVMPRPLCPLHEQTHVAHIKREILIKEISRNV